MTFLLYLYVEFRKYKQNNFLTNRVEVFFLSLDLGQIKMQAKKIHFNEFYMFFIFPSYKRNKRHGNPCNLAPFTENSRS